MELHKNRDSSQEIDAISDTQEQLEPFGSEESYWTVFRMFATDRNRGVSKSLQDVWNVLANYYDMSAEDMASLEETLLAWRSDIQHDLGERGVIASFLEYNDGFVVAERIGKPAPKKEVQNEHLATVTPIRPFMKMDTAPIVEAVVDPIETTRQRVVNILSSSGETAVKQSEVKKALIAEGKGDTPETLQHYIDALVEMGDLYKGKVGFSSVAWLSLSPFEVQTGKASAEARNDTVEKELDLSLHLDILRVLCVPGSHFQQKLTLQALWRAIQDQDNKSQAISDRDIDVLKRASQQLQTAGLVVAGGAKMGTGGVKTNSATSSKRRRSAKRIVFKVGLASQEVKEEIQNILKKRNPEEELRSKF